MRIEVENPPGGLFYQIQYHLFPATTTVQTFTRALSPEDQTALDTIIAQWNNAGQPPVPIPVDSRTISNTRTLNPGSTEIILNESQGGVIRSLRVKVDPELTNPEITGSILQNGDFESGNMDGWSGGDYSVSAQAAHSGSYGIKLNGGGNLERYIDTVPGQFYSVNFWARLDNETVAPTWGGLRLSIEDPSDWTLLSVSASLSNAVVPLGQWILMSKGFVAKGTQARLRINNFSGGGQWEASFDDFTLVPDGNIIPVNYEIRVYWDGESTPSIQTPVRNFFGHGLYDQRQWSSLPMAMDANGYICYFPMPFSQSAVIEIENKGTVQSQLTWEIKIDNQVPDMNQNGYFCATFQEETKSWDDNDFVILFEATGKGKFVGHTCTMNGDSGCIDYLEGDEIIYVDNEIIPSVFGTGTEDFYNEGWYFGSEGVFSLPYYGLIVNDDHCMYLGRMEPYRFQLTESIPFNQNIVINLEA
ncbi:unnamed protein product, partial [marine sediment metagenome]